MSGTAARLRLAAIPTLRINGESPLSADCATASSNRYLTSAYYCADACTPIVP